MSGGIVSERRRSIAPAWRSSLERPSRGCIAREHISARAHG
jgi:hypothetical protein